MSNIGKQSYLFPHLFLAALSLSACSRARAPAPAGHAEDTVRTSAGQSLTSRYQCLHEVVDVTGEASKETCERWAAEHERLLEEIVPGTDYTLTPLNAQSRTAPPIVHLETAAPAGTSRLKVLGATREALRAREAARRAFIEACQARDPVLSKESDVLGALATARPPGCGSTLLVMWTDLLHEVKGEANLATHPVNRRDMEAIFARLAEKERWTRGLLDHTDVRVVLRAPDPRRPPRNDPAVVQEFMRAVARSLGAESFAVQTYYAWGRRS